MSVTEFSSMTIGLSATPPSQASFGTSMLMVDDDTIAVDKRYKITSRSSFATDFVSTTDAYGWCAALWGQGYNPATAYIGKWIKTASSPYIVFPSPNSTIADWVAVAALGSLNITDGTNSDEVTTLDFTSVTDLDDVCTVIETALQAIAAPNITGLDTATCEVDGYNRIIIKNSTTGASAAGISTATASTGTDIAVTGLLGDGEFSQDGLDAETLGTSTAAILALDNTPFVLCQRGGSDSEQVAWVTYTNSLAKLTHIVTYDTDGKDPSITTDVGYQLGQLGYQKVHVEYTEWGDVQYSDGTLGGEYYPRTEASANMALTPLVGVYQSGKGTDGTSVISLTDGEKTALKDKGYDYLTRPATATHFATGLAAGGYEMRVMYGKLYTEAKIQEAVYGYMVSQSVVTFSDSDIANIEAIVVFWMDIMVNRKVLEPGYTITMPSAASFDAATKATKIMNLNDIADMQTQHAANQIHITANWLV